MGCSQQHDGQVHPEVEDLEDLRFGETEDDDSREFRQGDSREDAAARSLHGFGGTLPLAAHGRCVRTDDVRDELHSDSHSLRRRRGGDKLWVTDSALQFNDCSPSTHHDQIDQRDRVQGDVPQPHDARHIDDDQQHHEDHHEGENQIKSWAGERMGEDLISAPLAWVGSVTHQSGRT